MDAYNQILKNVTERKGAEHFMGVTVQPMIDPNSYELLIGATSDTQLGPGPYWRLSSSGGPGARCREGGKGTDLEGPKWLLAHED